jgi:thiamine biosynthesis lipoprotein
MTPRATDDLSNVIATRRFPFRAMAAEHEIVLAGEVTPAMERAVEAAVADVHRIESKYSRYRDDSVVAAINGAAGRADVAIDDETAALFRYADQCYALSEGRFDITSGVLRRAWDFRADPPRLPAQQELDRLLALIGWDRVGRDGRSVRLPLAGMEIDLGGIGKEYAADRAATILAERGVRHALVNLGGDVRAIGGRPDGTPWRIGIRHPRSDAPVAIASVEIREGAVATSGDYQRYLEVDGRRYCHILDPRTGWPVDAWQSMTVVSTLATVAGSLATIAMLLGDEAPALFDAHPVGWLGVDRRGEVRGTLGR